MPLSELSVSTQNYLKEIWSLEEWTKTPATASALAERMGLRISSVSDGLKRLAAADLIEHQPYGAIELTETGRSYALAMIRRHRLIETFLMETLGYTWDRVHDEAEVLEHAVSDFMVDRIDTLLGHPTRDPHGDPIPDSSGHISFPQTVPLSQCEPERRAFAALLDEGMVDVVRPHTPGEYTYWDYQAGRFTKDEGMRIDFQLFSPALAARVERAWIDKVERAGEGASDHTPVVVEIAD